MLKRKYLHRLIQQGMFFFALLAASGTDSSDVESIEATTSARNLNDSYSASDTSQYIEYSVLVNEEEQNRMEMLLEDLENVDIFCLNAPDQFYKFYFEWPGVETDDAFVTAIYWGKYQLGGSIDLGFLPFAIDSAWLNENELRGQLDTWALPRTLRLLTVERNSFDGTIHWAMLPAYMTLLNIQHNKFHGTVSISALPISFQSLYIAGNIFSCVQVPVIGSRAEVFGSEEYFCMKDTSDEEETDPLVTESTLSIADRSHEESRRHSSGQSSKSGHRHIRRIRDFFGGIPTSRDNANMHETLKAISETPYSPPKKETHEPVVIDDISDEVPSKRSWISHPFNQGVALLSTLIFILLCVLL